jgi:hypothetical protein
MARMLLLPKSIRLTGIYRPISPSADYLRALILRLILFWGFPFDISLYPKGSNALIILDSLTIVTLRNIMIQHGIYLL